MASDAGEEPVALATLPASPCGQKDGPFPAILPATRGLSASPGRSGSHLRPESDLPLFDEVNGCGERGGHANVPVVVGRREEHALTKGENPGRVERTRQVGSVL